jgi:hypothetical protein
MPRRTVIALAVAIAGGPAAAQSLEETALTLERSGAVSTIVRAGPGVVVADGFLEARVVDEPSCTVRITRLDRKPYTEMSSGWGDGPTTRSENLDALYKEVHYGRVIPVDMKRVPDVRGTRNGVVVEQTVDGKWRLPGSPGDQVWCQVWPKREPTCWDALEVSRILPPGAVSDSPERTARIDRAMTHLYGDLCKGAPKKVPF